MAIGGQYHTRISCEVHDPLLATALAVQTRDETGVIDQAVFVSCDLSAIRRKVQEDVRRRVKKRAADLDVRKILISATHTHTAPALTDIEETDLDPYDFMGSWAYRIPADREDVMRRAVTGGGYSARIVDGAVGPEGGDVLVNETVTILG